MDVAERMGPPRATLLKISHIRKMKGKRKTHKMDSTAEGISQDPMGTGFHALQLKELSSPIILSFLVWYPLCQNVGRFHSCITGLCVGTLLLNLWPCVRLQRFLTSQQTFLLRNFSSQDGTCS